MKRHDADAVSASKIASWAWRPESRRHGEVDSARKKVAKLVKDHSRLVEGRGLETAGAVPDL